MIIKTSYFAKLRQVTIPNPISIARFTPKWFNGKCYKRLSPSSDLLNRYKAGLIDEETYTKEFNNYLESLDPKEIESDLMELTEGDIGVLLCYEKSTDFCHRHLVAKWLNTHLKLNVTEL